MLKQQRVRIVCDHSPENPREWECNLGTMACWHRRYSLGDGHDHESPREFLREIACEANARLGDILYEWDHGPSADWLMETLDCPWSEAEKIIHDHAQSMVSAVLAAEYVILPLYLYDHSGVTMNTTGFHCPWDSGQVGYIVCSLHRAQENWSAEQAAGWDHLLADWRNPGQQITLRDATLRALRDEVAVYDQYLRGDVYGFIVEERDASGGWEAADSCWGFYGGDPETNGMADHLESAALVEMAKQAEPEYPRH